MKSNSPETRTTVFILFFTPCLSGSSDDPIVPERLEQHCVLDIAENPADAVGVCGAGEVWVECLSLLPVVAIDGLLLVQLADVVLGIFRVVSLSCEVGEVFLQVRRLDFVCQDVSLVEEKDDGRVEEPWRMDGGVEQSQTLVHTVNGFSLLQDLVVLAEGGQEDEGGDIFKAVNPLPTLRLLTAHVHNP